jgi:regulator of protease activity HflC (stomatin/prohibitin superfamily)
MKKLGKLLLISVLMAGVVGCNNVPSGNVGVLVHKLGGAKGVDSEELGPGRVWLGINDELFLFPTFTQNEQWAGPQAIHFQSKETLDVVAAIGMSYHVDPKKVSVLFQKYRKGIEEISDIYLRMLVQDSLVKHASFLSIDEISGEGKAALLDSVENEVKAAVAEQGIIIEKLNYLGQLGLPPSITESINKKVEATQKTAQRENEVAQSKAEAQKKVEEATGEAQAKLLVAQAEAKAIELMGNAVRSNPGVAELKAIEKWNGVLPQYQLGSSTPFINVK